MHLAKAHEYETEVDVLTKLLDREEARFSNLKPNSTPAKEPEEPLADYIVKLLDMRPMGKAEIREYAERAGYQGDGRTFHATLVNLSRTARIREIAEDVYSLPEATGSLNLVGKLNG